MSALLQRSKDFTLTGLLSLVDRTLNCGLFPQAKSAGFLTREKFSQRAQRGLRESPQAFSSLAEVHPWVCVKVSI